MSTNATAGQLYDAIKGFWKTVKGSDIHVARYQMDEYGSNCTVTQLPVKTNIYEITLLKLIKDVSVTTTILTKFSS